VLHLPKQLVLPEHSSKMVHLCTPDFDENYVPFYHHPCICNEEVSLRNRVLGEVPGPSQRGIDLMGKGIDLIIAQLHHTAQENLGEFANNYVGKKQNFM